MGDVTSEPDPRLLGTYLNDHLAGAGAGVDLASRIARVHQGTPSGPALAHVAAEIARDRTALLQIMKDLGVPRRRTKALLGRLAEKVGRLKLNNRLLRRSPMSSVVELETLWLGVNGKSRLWRSLRAVAAGDNGLSPQLLDHLLDRARQQADDLEDLRMQAVEEAFGVLSHRM
ncbi:hypothetical protein MXD62_01755 [Frankia sp. Mgl5]|uniref:hypothetical protein n=1 Tax=Frankia sp. Mgl5 TaxID=2933793 RepID=UPI00200CDB00|nr:hypothetical protein [Frankia sp. Mgl5]MCK9925896.1 hypothetical protein [Frankia sp. Mgl5]